jgi:predicted nucleic acid-binding Zn ribbon protein
MGLIEIIGDRKNSGFCIRCGKDLLIPWNDYQCCPDCTEFLAYHKKLAENRKVKSTRVKKCVIPSYAIARQRKTIGGIPT